MRSCILSICASVSEYLWSQVGILAYYELAMNKAGEDY